MIKCRERKMLMKKMKKHEARVMRICCISKFGSGHAGRREPFWGGFRAYTKFAPYTSRGGIYLTSPSTNPLLIYLGGISH